GSIDRAASFEASRYGKGEGADYLNCPLSEERYKAFRQALLSAELSPLRDFEEPRFFERCLPIEELAARGEDTMRFGPMKPVGLCDPATGRRPYAVVQLRQDDRHGNHYNMVGFQTRLKWPEQNRVFGLIPALAGARFLRHGQVHRNTFIEAPKVLQSTTQLLANERMLVAGQLSGVEGYIESIASGLVAGVNAARIARALEPAVPPGHTLAGALLRSVTRAGRGRFQPVKISFGLLEDVATPGVSGRAGRRKALAEGSLEAMRRFAHAVFDD
ncbi:methylenetetrahydrofolate--tRNA-(uracil(54)-C(5))-methyltransferase (FADH(2)-oxidizing) TrmFO, partial [Acidobacteriota bacterium]